MSAAKQVRPSDKNIAVAAKLSQTNDITRIFVSAVRDIVAVVGHLTTKLLVKKNQRFSKFSVSTARRCVDTGSYFGVGRFYSSPPPPNLEGIPRRPATTSGIILRGDMIFRLVSSR